jgi:hypothetical protein
MTNSRPIGTGFRNSIEAQANTELLLIFVQISHPNLGAPIRVVSEDINGISYANTKIVNYNWNGYNATFPIPGSSSGDPNHLYLGCPFSFTLLTDGDAPPTAKVSVQNVDRRIGQSVLSLTSSPTFRMSMLKYSDFVAGTYDTNNALSPSGSPEVEYDAPYLFLKNISGDEAVLTADITTFDVANEPCPSIRTTQDRCPGLYR